MKTRTIHFRRNGLRSRGMRGFTLVEVLTAILVLTITIPVLIGAYSAAHDVAAFARQRSEALSIGQSVMEQLTATGDWYNGNSTGDERYNNSPTQYHWEASTNTWTDLDSSYEDEAVEQLTVTITWKYHNTDCQIVLDTLVYDAENTSIVSTTEDSGGGITGLP